MRRNNHRFKKIFLWVLGIFLIFAVILYFSLVRPVQKALSGTANLKALAKQTFASAKTQNLSALGTNLTDLQKAVKQSKAELKTVFIYKHLPFLGFVFSDAENALAASEYLLSAGQKAVVAIEPYADLIGFKKGSEFSAQPTEKRLQTAILTIDKLNPQIDKIDDDLIKAKALLAKINPAKYPKNFFGIKVQEKVKNYYDQVYGIIALAADAKPLFKKLPYILGKDEKRSYLVLFLNDNELRATGGFITAYAIFTIDQGEIRVADSGDIYDLDNTIAHPTAPDAITRYHKGVYKFYIRDSNLSPDNVESINTFESLLKKSSLSLKYDGIVTINTKVLVDVLKVLGPTTAGDVTFTGETDNRCDCAQVIYELENLITKPTPYFRTNRKGMLSTLLYAIMQKALGVSPSQYWGRLAQTFLTDLEQKDVVIYLKDVSSQKAIESLNFAGRIMDFSGDYLHINNVNFAGAKSNMYIRYTLTSKATSKGDTLEREVTLVYKNIHTASDCNLERGNLCLNAPLRNWVRLYVPEGARLKSFVGSETKIREYTELGKQVFEGFLVVNPLGMATIKVTYTVPKSVLVNNRYQLLLQKQSGVATMDTTVSYNGVEQKSALQTDETFSF